MEASPLVPFIDLRLRDLAYADELLHLLDPFIREGRYIGGPRLELFESSFASFVGSSHCVGVGNGLDALKLILLALDIGPGDEVIVPAQTFIATWLAVIQVGARPVSADVEEETGNIDPVRVRNAMSPRTRAVIAVHLHGRPANLDALSEVCRNRNVHLVEDAAQAHGAEYQGQIVGSWGVAAAFSFYPTKNLGALGDGGAITTSNAAIAAKALSLRSYGASADSKYAHDLPGVNSRLDPLQATILTRYLRDLPEWNARRTAIAHNYHRELSSLKSIILPPLDPPGIKSVWHHYVVQCHRRDLLRETLAHHGIETEIHYPELPEESSAIRNGATHRMEGRPPQMALQRRSNSLSIPLHPWLTEVSQERIVAALKTADRLIVDGQRG